MTRWGPGVVVTSTYVLHCCHKLVPVWCQLRPVTQQGPGHPPPTDGVYISMLCCIMRSIYSTCITAIVYELDI